MREKSISTLSLRHTLKWLFFVAAAVTLSACKTGFSTATGASLSRLTISSGTLDPSFSSDTYSYSVTVANSVESVTVNARLQNSEASMTVNGNALSDDTDSSALSLDIGTNTITIHVESANETEENDYVITVTRQAQDSNDASLSTLSVDGTSITADAAKTEYSADVSYFLNSTRILVDSADAAATLSGFSGSGTLTKKSKSDRQTLTEGENTFTFNVSATDGTEQAYSISLQRGTIDDLTYQAFIKADNQTVRDNAKFGAVQAMSGSYLVVTAPDHDAGKYVSIYHYADGAWAWEANLPVLSDISENLGAALAISEADGEVMIVAGAPNADKVYYLAKTGDSWPTTWNELEIPNDVTDTDEFGFSLALQGTTLAVGAPASSAVLTYERDGDGWAADMVLYAEEGETSDRFGETLAFNGENELYIGAPAESSSTDQNRADNSANGAGAVYVFSRENSSSNWADSAYIKAPNAGSSDSFGKALAVANNLLVVGAPSEASNATDIQEDTTSSDDSLANAGAAYIFTRTTENADWAFDTYAKGNNAQAMGFGSAVAILSEGMIAIGAPFENGRDTGMQNLATTSTVNYGIDNAGAVFILEAQPETDTSTNYVWNYGLHIKARDIVEGDNFGATLATNGSQLSIAMPLEDTGVGGVGQSQNNSGTDTGAIYVIGE